MEESDKIEKKLIPTRVCGALIYRCPYTDCRKKFNAKSKCVDHIRAIHLLMKKFCESCQRNVSFVSYQRHVRSCMERKAAVAANTTTNISHHVTRSTNVDGTNVPQVAETSAEQIDEMQTPNCTNVGHSWSLEKSREDEIDTFAKFVASEMRMLARNDQLHLKKRLQRMLLEYKSAEESSSNNEIIEADNCAEVVNQSSKQTIVSSDQDCVPKFSFLLTNSNESTNKMDSQNIESMDCKLPQSLLTPKLESVVGDNVLKCLLCGRQDLDLFHFNVNEIRATYSGKRILDIVEELQGPFMPNLNENGVCCHECFVKIGKFDLQRYRLGKILQAELRTFNT